VWPVRYLTAERAPEILAAQAEWRTWLLRCRRPDACRGRWRPPRSGGGARAAVTLALALGARSVTRRCAGARRCHKAGWRIDKAGGGALFTTV